MNRISLARASSIGPGIALLNELGGKQALDSTFQRLDLPLQIKHAPDAFLPVRDMIGFHESAARAVGVENFGLMAAQAASFDDLGLYGRYVAQASTLHDAMQRAVTALELNQSGSSAELTIGRATGVIGCRSSHTGVVGWHHVADQAVVLVVDLIRRYAGPGWCPMWVEVDYRETSSETTLAKAFDVPVYYERPAVSVAFETDLLGNPNTENVAGHELLTFGEVSHALSPVPRNNPVATVLQIVRMRLLGGKTDLEVTASKMGLGARTLQRLLKAEGTTYRDVVAIARRDRADELLSETTLPIAEIAWQLGYSSHAHFDRAFRQWSGMSPSEARQENRKRTAIAASTQSEIALS